MYVTYVTYSKVSQYSPPKSISKGPHLLAHAHWFWLGVSRPSEMKEAVFLFMTADCRPLVISSLAVSDRYAEDGTHADPAHRGGREAGTAARGTSLPSASIHRLLPPQPRFLPPVPPPGWSRRCRSRPSSRWGRGGLCRHLALLRTSAGRAGPGMAAAAAERRARPCLLLPAVHPVLGAAGGDDLRQEAIRWVQRPLAPRRAPPRPPQGHLEAAAISLPPPWGGLPWAAPPPLPSWFEFSFRLWVI